jgi:hypothetical protein
VLAEDIFGDEDSKPPARVHPYNSAARPLPNNFRYGNFHQAQQQEEIQKAVQQSREKFPHNRNPGLSMVDRTAEPIEARKIAQENNMEVEADLDPVEKLNKSIALLQQSQLQKLQMALVTLKSSQSDNSATRMEEDSFTLVGPSHKKRTSNNDSGSTLVAPTQSQELVIARKEIRLQNLR